jgi:hypothetical protein
MSLDFSGESIMPDFHLSFSINTDAIADLTVKGRQSDTTNIMHVDRQNLVKHQGGMDDKI